MLDIERITLALYLATYIQEEISRGATTEDINMSMLSMALDAYDGGAANE
jgi:hypothetical protein